jgi:ATP-dependent Clp protease ATP-binding subunit ClpC
MFERYTEKARRVIFFARYEASQFGSPYIEAEHLLLGLLREDKALVRLFFHSHPVAEPIRKEIEANTTIREKVPTSIDLPLSNESKRVLAYAAEEAERLSHKHIGTEHMFLGLLREEKCFAATLLRDRGVNLSSAREEISRAVVDVETGERAKEVPSLLKKFSTELNTLTDQLHKLVGRESELERLMHILCRFTRGNPVLVGKRGVGKKTIIGGLAQRIDEGAVPATLAEKSIIVLDLSAVAAMEKDPSWAEKLRTALSTGAEKGVILVLDELHEPGNLIIGSSSAHLERILKGLIVSGKVHCISTATPDGYNKSIENRSWLEQHFRVIQVRPASEDEAIKVLFGIKETYEKFHAVIYTDEALTYAVYYASSCIKGRVLPGKAVDVMDEAGSYVKLRQSVLPDEIVECQKRIRFIVRRMENAIANHEPEKARFYSEEERKERQNLTGLRGKYKLNETAVGTVTREVIEDVVARWTGMSIDSVRQSRAENRENSKDQDS